MLQNGQHIVLPSICSKVRKHSVHEATTPNGTIDNVTDETADLAERYQSLTECVQDTIKHIVPEKERTKKNGRAVSQETKKLFTNRAKEYQKKKPSKQRRKEWNKRIRIACRDDYRQWVARWTQKVENADNRGDTKAVYQGAGRAGAQREKTRCNHKTDRKNGIHRSEK